MKRYIISAFLLLGLTGACTRGTKQHSTGSDLNGFSICSLTSQGNARVSFSRYKAGVSSSRVNCQIPDLNYPQLPTDREIEKNLDLDAHWIPSELDPEPLNRILGRIISSKNSPQGVQIAVGSERGFLTASAPYLILADSDKFVRLYNFINLALIAAADKIETYRELRFAKEEDVWKNVNFGGRSQSLLFEFWKRTQHSKYLARGNINWNLMLNSPPQNRNRFIKENFDCDSYTNRVPLDQDYIWNNDRFLKLKEKQQSGRIAIYAIDFTDIEQVERLISILEKGSLKTLAVDFSNIHSYVKWKEQLLPTFEKFKDSYVVLSQQSSNLFRLIRVMPQGGGFGLLSFRYYIFSPGEDYRDGILSYVLPNLPAITELNSEMVTWINEKSIVNINDNSCSVGLP